MGCLSLWMFVCVRDDSLFTFSITFFDLTIQSITFFRLVFFDVCKVVWSDSFLPFRYISAELSVRRGNGFSCIFRYNNAAFAVGMGHGSVVSFSIYQCRVRCRQEERFNLLHFLCWHGDRFSLVFFDATMQSSLLEWGKVQSCPFRCNKAEFPVRIGNGPVLPFSIWQCSVRCWDGQRFFLSFSI